jgi:T-complex protein 1 subunit beta
LADNGGCDSSDLVSRLRAAHYEGKMDAGLGGSKHDLGWFATADVLDMNKGSIGNLSVTESYARLCSVRVRLQK